MPLKALLFFFWSLGSWYGDGAQSTGYKTWKECQESRLVYEAEGETTSECYAMEVRK